MMGRYVADRSEQLKQKIESKKGHIRYLKNRIQDPTPLLKEIERRKAEIAKHQTAIEKLYKMFSDLPAALNQAEADLQTLLIKMRSTAPKDLTRHDLMERIARLQATIEQLKEPK